MLWNKYVYFRMGKAMAADTSQANGYSEFRSSKESGWNLIHVGDEFYKIIDAVIFGDWFTIGKETPVLRFYKLFA